MVKNSKTTKLEGVIKELLDVFVAYKKANKDKKVTFWEWVKIAIEGKDLSFVVEHGQEIKAEFASLTDEELEGLAHGLNEKMGKLELVGEKGLSIIEKSIKLIVSIDDLWEEFREDGIF